MKYLALAALLGLSSVAVAQDTPETPEDADKARALELYQNGERLYDDGLYAEAIEAFQASFEVSKEPALLYNIANAYERLGDLSNTIKALNRYRVYAKAEERDSLERRIANLEKREEAAKAAATPAPVVTPAPVDTAAVPPTAPTPTAESSSGGVPWLAVAGGAIMAGGAAVAGITYAQSRSLKRDGDSEAWENMRPINNAGVAIAGVGAVTLGVGIAIPLGGKKTGGR